MKTRNSAILCVGAAALAIAAVPAAKAGQGCGYSVPACPPPVIRVPVNPPPLVRVPLAPPPGFRPPMVQVPVPPPSQVYRVPVTVQQPGQQLISGTQGQGDPAAQAAAANNAAAGNGGAAAGGGQNVAAASQQQQQQHQANGALQQIIAQNNTTPLTVDTPVDGVQVAGAGPLQRLVNWVRGAKNTYDDAKKPYDEGKKVYDHVDARDKDTHRDKARDDALDFRPHPLAPSGRDLVYGLKKVQQGAKDGILKGRAGTQGVQDVDPGLAIDAGYTPPPPPKYNDYDDAQKVKEAKTKESNIFYKAHQQHLSGDPDSANWDRTQRNLKSFLKNDRTKDPTARAVLEAELNSLEKKIAKRDYLRARHEAAEKEIEAAMAFQRSQ